MKVKMIRTAAGPDAVYVRGKVYDIPAEVAKRFLEANPPAAVDPSADPMPRPLEAATQEGARKRARS